MNSTYMRPTTTSSKLTNRSAGGMLTSRTNATSNGFNTTRSNASNNNFNDNDRKKILSKFDPRAVSVCTKCHGVFLPIWRAVRNEFKRAQLPQQQGCILSTPFIAILQHFGLRLSSTEIGILLRAFKDNSSQLDVVKFNDFLRVCLVCETISEE